MFLRMRIFVKSLTDTEVSEELEMDDVHVHVINSNTKESDDNNIPEINVMKSDNENGTKYLYLSLILVMMTGALQSSFTGVQAILELFFSQFLFICSSRTKSLSTTAINIFITLSQLSAISGGLFADWIFGNFHTQNFSNIIASVGICLVLFGSWQFTITKPHCCVMNTTNAVCDELEYHKVLSSISLDISSQISMSIVLVGFVMLAVGYGQTNAIQSVFVGDQFPEGKSSAKQKSFSWYYLWINVGNLANESGMPIIRQTYGFVISIIIATGSFGLASVLFISGMCLYVRKKPSNKLCYQKCVKRNKQFTESQPLLEESYNSNSILTRDNAIQVLRILGVYVPLVVFWGVFYQQNSTWVLQGSLMNCYISTLHIPPDLMPSINDLMVILIIPILDYIIYPHLKKSLKLQVKPLHKMVIGMTCAALSFIFASLLQLYINSQPVVSCRGDVSILWQLPQLILISFAEVLVAVTGLEFAYSQSPPQLRNIVKSLWCITQGLGSLMNAIIALINLSLIYEFLIYSILMFIVVFVFCIINWNFRYKTENK